jgi:hypothetical protein
VQSIIKDIKGKKTKTKKKQETKKEKLKALPDN